MITNNAEGKPQENPGASWVFLVTDSTTTVLYHSLSFVNLRLEFFR